MFDGPLDEMIGSIYDAVIEPSRWHDAIDAIRRRFNFEIAMLSVLRLPTGTPVVQVSVNVPEPYLRNILDYNDDIVEMWGGPQEIRKLMAEEPTRTTDVLDPGCFANNRYYREWCEPQGLVDQVVIPLAHDRTMAATIGLGRHISKVPIPDSEIRALRVLAPHLRRAVVISNLLDDATSRAATFDAALSAMSSGAVIVDERMGILHSNDVARRMLDAEDPIRSAGGKLELPVELVPGQLVMAVAASTGPESALRRRGMGIPTRRRDGTPLVVHVMPLKHRTAYSGLETSAACAVFIAESGAQEPLPIDAASLLFELTPAEARVFELAATGQSNGEIAIALSVAETTVKTHLASVFGKTGTNRRADLVRLATEMGLRP